MAGTQAGSTRKGCQAAEGLTTASNVARAAAAGSYGRFLRLRGRYQALQRGVRTARSATVTEQIKEWWDK